MKVHHYKNNNQNDVDVNLKKYKKSKSKINLNLIMKRKMIKKLKKINNKLLRKTIFIDYVLEEQVMSMMLKRRKKRIKKFSNKTMNNFSKVNNKDNRKYHWNVHIQPVCYHNWKLVNSRETCQKREDVLKRYPKYKMNRLINNNFKVKVVIKSSNKNHYH